MTDTPADAITLMARADILAQFTEEAGMLTRRSYTPALRQANDTVAEWMRLAGMTVREDAVCNLIGRYEGMQANCKTLLLGSHLDSVRNAGRYDGPLGVLTALACVARLQQAGRRLPFAIEVIAFADEEGLRYNSFIGSSALAGAFDRRWLEMPDKDGVSLNEAIRALGGDPDALESCRRESHDLLGYCETHIEQGPFLEAHGLPVGVVSAITGLSRFTVAFNGRAGHAGTVPMPMRRDALCAAAEFVLAVERLANDTPGLVGTVGEITVQPGASNVIPAVATLSLDLRHQDDRQRTDAVHTLRAQANEIATRRSVTLTWQTGAEIAAVPCAPLLANTLATTISSLGYSVERLPSGAGHDGMVMAAITPVAMLFVRCEGGVSHHPDESITAEDAGVGIEVISRFLELLATERI